MGSSHERSSAQQQVQVQVLCAMLTQLLLCRTLRSWSATWTSSSTWPAERPSLLPCPPEPRSAVLQCSQPGQPGNGAWMADLWLLDDQQVHTVAYSLRTCIHSY